MEHHVTICPYKKGISVADTFNFGIYCVQLSTPADSNFIDALHSLLYIFLCGSSDMEGLQWLHG